MKNTNDPRFIPCGDSMERMEELNNEQLEAVSGGAYTECNRGYICPKCSSDNIRVFDHDGKLGYFCFNCRRGEELKI